MLPRNVVTKHILVTDLSQQLKKQRDFLRWMGRRYTPANPDQGAAFFTGAEKIDELRSELLQGSFDVLEEDLFTNQVAGPRELELEQPADQVSSSKYLLSRFPPFKIDFEELYREDGTND